MLANVTSCPRVGETTLKTPHIPKQFNSSMHVAEACCFTSKVKRANVFGIVRCVHTIIAKFPMVEPVRCISMKHFKFAKSCGANAAKVNTNHSYNDPHALGQNARRKRSLRTLLAESPMDEIEVLWNCARAFSGRI